MERQTVKNDHEFYRQIKIFPPGCQTALNGTLSSNDNYFCYCSTMTVNIFYLKSFQLKCIFNPRIEKYVKSVCLNSGKSNELAVFYETEVIIFNIDEEKVKETFKFANLKYMEFNTENKILLVTKNEEIFIFDMSKKKLDQLKGVDKALTAKWYPFNNTELVYATKENKLCLRNINEKKGITISLEVDPKTLICEMSWYDIDENYKYLLVGTNNGRIFLIDWSQSLVLMKFEKFGTAITNLIWLKYEPGTFISLTEKSNRVAFWNVSKKNYNEIAKFSDCAIFDCLSLSDPSRILMTLENGSAAVYDVEKRKNIFNLEPNHSNTIFDLKYSPLLYGIFATCSYDSTIKIWDITHNKIICNIDIDYLIKNSANKLLSNIKTNVYCIAWSPHDKDLLISGDSGCMLRIWDISKQKMITSCSLNLNNREGHIVGIDWDAADNHNNRILSTCIDSVYLLNYSNLKLEIIKQIVLHTPVYLIKTNPFNRKEFAVASFDSSIKIFNLDTDQPVKTLTGHTMKVFGVFYNKHRKGLMASTSEDFSVGVWELESNKNIFLKGHKHNTRHAVWLSEIPNILITGSWDGEIRIWNVDLAVCIADITEHYSDVYGIDLSPDHPYLLTSCSRDNSIRFWNLLGLSNKLTDSIINFTSDSVSDEICNSNTDLITRADLISNKYYYHDGLKDFWDLLRVATKIKEYSNENNRIFYITDLYSAYKSKAQKLEFTYFSKTKFNFSIKKEDLLKAAIELCAKAGDWEKFCELSVEANDWEKAIMAAPNVSVSYWKELTRKYADYCAKKNNPSKKFASLLSNQLEPALNILMNSGEYEDAKLIWLTRGNKQPVPKENSYLLYENPDTFNLNQETINNIDEKLKNLTIDDNLFKIVYSIAKDYLQKGFPILAAGSFLSINDTFNTFKILIRAAEYEIAYMLMKILNYKMYEEEILYGLCLKELKKQNMSNITSILQNTENASIKVTIATMIKNFMESDVSIYNEFKLDEKSIVNNLCQEGNEFLSFICLNDLESAIRYFYDKTLNIAIDLKSKIIKIYNIEEMFRLNFYFSAINLKKLSHSHERIAMRKLAVAAFLDSLNRNFKACLFYLSEITRLLKKNYKLDDTESIFVSYACSYISEERIKYEGEYQTNFQIQIPLYKDYLTMQAEFEKEGTKEALKFHCGDYGCFFYIREELLPVNINNQVVSSFNAKVIKGRMINIRNMANISYSQALEWFKLISFCPFVDDFNLFNPC